MLLKFRNICTLLTLLAIGAKASGASPLYRLMPPQLVKEQSVYSLDSEFYLTSNNFSQDTRTIEAASGEYRYLKISPEATFSIGSKHQIFMAADFVSSQSVDSTYTRKNTNFSEISGGYRFFARGLGLLWMPEIQLVVPMFEVDTNTDQSLLGEGAISVEPALWISKSFRSARIYLRSSYQWRSGGRAQLLHYAFGGMYRFKNRWRIKTSIDGFTSITDDIYSETKTERLNVIGNANAGSFKFYSLNPESLSAHVSLSLPLAATHFLEIGYQRDMTGMAYASGDTVLLKWSWHQTKEISEVETIEPKFELDLESVNEQ